MDARTFGSLSFHNHPEPKRADPPPPAMVTVEQWDYELGRFVERLVPNPEIKPYTCEECGLRLCAHQVKNYVGPVSGDGFRRNALVCERCFEVLA